MSAIIIAVEEFNSSGGLRILSSISEIAAEAEIDVTIICPDYAAKPFFPLHSDVRIQVIKTGKRLRRIRYFLSVFFLPWKCKELIVTGNYRLISLVGVSSRLAAGVRPVLIVQGLDGVSLIKLTTSGIIEKAVNYIFLGISRRISCHRVYVSRFLQVSYGMPGILIPNFVSSKFFNHYRSEAINNSDHFIIGCVCTSAPNKGFDIFLDTYRQIKSDPRVAHLNIEFVCATQDQVLMEQHAGSGIIFSRPDSDDGMMEFYQNCQIFLSLSISEGFGLPALEAMASGCAVVCSNSGGVTDFVINDQTGILLSNRSVVDVRESIIRLIQEKSLRLRLAEAGRECAKQYTYENFSSRYLQLFAELGVFSR